MPPLIGSEGVIDMEAFGSTIKELLLSWIIVQIILAAQSSIMLHLVGVTKKREIGRKQNYPGFSDVLSKGGTSFFVAH